jgi:hypothetical protein
VPSRRNDFTTREFSGSPTDVPQSPQVAYYGRYATVGGPFWTGCVHQALWAVCGAWESP